jgi:hypothetical protein
MKEDDLFKRCKEGLERELERESDCRKRWTEDLKFANADPDNGYQWEEKLKKSRESDAKPCLTINKVKQHNRQITNDARQNKPSVRVSPVDSGADPETAEIINGIIRHIEANSSADTAYDTAAEHAVDGGIGYWRIVTDYCDAESFDQDIYIKRVKNPLTVVLGRHNEADGSDAREGWVFEDISKTEFKRLYPDADPVAYDSSIADHWNTEDSIRVCEYYEITDEKDTLVANEDGTTFLLSTIEDKALVKEIKKSGLKTRNVSKPKLTWYKLAGDGQKLEERPQLGKYIPIVKVVGEEVEIDGKIERKGHTRGMKDAQRMYNYNSSASVEYGALQTKVPWIIAGEAVAGYEEYWDTANTTNHSRLTWNAYDENGQQLPKPERPTPPAPAMLYLEGMRTASEELKMASGQYDASMGAKSNETSGRAIIARQREGDTATFHFIDNVARAIKYTGKILVDLIPKIYDTERVVRIIGEDGTDDKVKINPQLEGAYQEKKDASGKIEKIYNPGVGRYDVTVTVGPSYSTKRQEAQLALTEMSSRNPELMKIAGDIIMRAMDFPMADELADRMKKAIPAELQDDDESDIPPQVKGQMQQMQQQIEQYEDALQNALTEVEKLEAKNEIQLQIEQMRLEAADEREELKSFTQIILKRMDQNQSMQTAALEADQAVDTQEEITP